MVESSNSIFHLRFAVVLYDTGNAPNEVYQTDLRYFDEFSDACIWIKTHGSMYAAREPGDRKKHRFFRIEKRYYII